MIRVHNISFYIYDNQICLAEYLNNDSNLIIDSGFFNLENLGIETKDNEIILTIKYSVSGRYIFKASGKESALKILTAIFYEIYRFRSENNQFKIKEDVTLLQ